ncbi:MAG: EFR1 family ferrodoxin [Clostridiales bacterium]|nr:EFR1 family ferrodoxin [Clostridiales bacterium]
MIFYFSATGNCKYVASRLSKGTNEEMVSIIDCMKDGRYRFSIKPGESIGIVSPTYFFKLPAIVCDFLEKAEFLPDGKPYVYFVSTYGTSCGCCGSVVNAYMTAKGFPLDARFSIKMPDSWTPMFDLSDEVRVKRINEAAEPQIDDAVRKVQEGDRGDFMKMKLPGFAGSIFYKSYDKQRTTDHFHVEDSCVGCGLCAGKCPVDAIEMQDGKPVWTKEKCLACLGCLHRCPTFSIQYGDKTKKHGQYRNPHVLS